LPVILATTRAEERESEQRLVSIFLWEQGKFKPFLDLVKSREKNGYDSYFEAAMGMPIGRVIPLWQDYLARIAARRAEILRLPLSAALPDEAAFHKFAASYGISVAVNKSQGKGAQQSRHEASGPYRSFPRKRESSFYS
jgi:hypothetical protein